MNSSTRTAVSVAATLSGIAFFMLMIGLPLILNSLFELENSFANQHKNYMEMSNKMWQTLEDKGMQASRFRQKRQCKKKFFYFK